MYERAQITRFNEDTIVTEGNEKFFEIQNPINTDIQTDDEYYSVQTGDNLRTIANMMYRDARLWWIIAEFNDIIDPFKNLVVGKMLRCPSLSRVRQEIV